MKKTFVSNLVLLMSLNLLIKPFWILGIDRGVQNTLGYQIYGMYANLFAFSMILITFLDFGINNFTSSLIAKNKENIGNYILPLFTFKAISSLIYLGLTLFLGKIYGYDSLRIKLLALLGLNQILSYLYLFFRSMVGGLQLFKTDAFLSVIDRVLMIFLCGLMLWTGYLNLSIHSFIYAQTISYTVAVAICFMVLKKHLKFTTFTISKEFFFPVLRQMLPYALLSLIMTLYTRMDNILLQKLTSDGDFHNGVYASAFRLLEAANMMAILVSMLLLPIFSKMLEKKENITPLVQLSSSIMIIPALTVSIACYLYKESIMTILYPQSTNYAIETFGLLIICFVGFATMYVYGTLLTANGNLKILNILALCALILNGVLNYYLIPQKLAYGAAIAAVFTQLFIAFTNTFWGIKILKIQFDKSFIKGFAMSVLVITPLCFTINYFVSNWLAGIIICGLLCFVVMITFRLFEPNDILKLLKLKGNQ